MHDDLEGLMIDRLKQSIAEGRADRSMLDGYRERGFDVEGQESVFGAEQDSLPCNVVASRPSDVVFFDQNLFHASFGGDSKLRMFTLCYCTVPEDKASRACQQASYERTFRSAQALSLGDFNPLNDGLHHPEFLQTNRPTLRRLIEPLIKLGYI